ncbi:MAG: pyruvate kinase [Gammaproteobacteria bacterium]|nr:pyruvate kinase [Gammaproteobacteria bacterium]
MIHRRRTKIICTIGPATADYNVLKSLSEAGMNIVRLNMSHADQDSAKEVINWVKTLNREVKYPIAILLDTQGPEIRTGDIPEPILLAKGEVIPIFTTKKKRKEKGVLIDYENLSDLLEIGSRLTIDNGLINFEITEISTDKLTGKVVDGGSLGSRKHVNLPGSRLNMPAITPKDRDDIEFGIRHDVDFIALSFVGAASDVEELREALGAKAKNIKIIAKIEDSLGVSNIAEIIRAADGVMVARGDLGIETAIAKLPNIQREIVHECARSGKRSIVATHLLESMIDNPIPTRAEVTDVANAIYEGVDGIMLSGETSIGSYPVRCVKQLHEIAVQAESWPGLGYEQELIAETDKQHIATNAVALAEDIKAAGIVVITRRGVMADLVTNARPQSVCIYAFTNHSQTRRRLALNRAVHSHRIAFSQEPEKTLQRALHILLDKEGIPKGEKVVVISDVLAGGNSDAIQLRDLG